MSHTYTHTVLTVINPRSPGKTECVCVTVEIDERHGNPPQGN